MCCCGAREAVRIDYIDARYGWVKTSLCHNHNAFTSRNKTLLATEVELKTMSNHFS